MTTTLYCISLTWPYFSAYRCLLTWPSTNDYTYGHCSIGNSSSISVQHQPAEFQESVFKPLQEDEVDRNILAASGVWFKFYNRDNQKPFQWSSESMICTQVQQVLSDVTREAGLDKIMFFQEMQLAQRYHADIWIVKIHDEPIGVVKVKKPSSPNSEKSIMNDKNSLGQLFDYVNQLRSYSGRQYSFGILTTYLEWRFVWLPDNDDIARSIPRFLLTLNHRTAYQYLTENCMLARFIAVLTQPCLP